MGQLRSLLIVLAVLAAGWTAIVVMDAGARTGDWSAIIRNTVILASAAGLIGLIAARLDDLIDDVMSGQGGAGPRGRRRPMPVKVRIGRRPRRPPGRPG